MRLPRAMAEAIFVLPQVPPGTPTPQGLDRSYICSSPSISQRLRLPRTMTAQDQTSDGLPPPSPKMIRASYSVGCKTSLTRSHTPPSPPFLPWGLDLHFSHTS